MKQYSTRVSVRQIEEQHNETKHSVKRRKKEIRNTRDGLEPLLCLSWGMVMVVGGRSLSSGPEHNVHK